MAMNAHLHAIRPNLLEEHLVNLHYLGGKYETRGDAVTHEVLHNMIEEHGHYSQSMQVISACLLGCLPAFINRIHWRQHAPR